MMSSVKREDFCVIILVLNSLFTLFYGWPASSMTGKWETSGTAAVTGVGGASMNCYLELVNMRMNLKTHIVKIICFALDRGGEEIRMTLLHEEVNTNQQHKHYVIWFKSLILQGEVTWSSCVLIRLPFWQNYEDYGIWLALFICLLIARLAELDGRSPTVYCCLHINTHPENGLKSTSDAKRSLSLQLQNSSLISYLE